MGEAAVAAAQGVGYVGAGTVEFIAEQDGRFYFMEMNTRLQVEHPVTEMITGLDLVEWQLRVAAGEPLPLTQDELRDQRPCDRGAHLRRGPRRATSCRRPARSRTSRFPARAPTCASTPACAQGDAITPFYDPMIAKLIVHGDDRAAALARLRAALARRARSSACRPTSSSCAASRRAAAFAGAELDTGLIERNRAELLPPREPVPAEVLAAAALAELAHEEEAQRASARRDRAIRYSPWHAVDGWRLNEESHHDFVFSRRAGDGARACACAFRRRRAARAHRHRRLARVDGGARKARAVRDGRDWHVFCDGTLPDARAEGRAAGRSTIDAAAGSLAAPMPGA